MLEALEEMNLFSGNFGLALGVGSAGGLTQGNAVATDAQGNVYVAGTFQGTVNFNPSAVQPSMLVSLGGESAFVAKYSPSGSLVWAENVGTGPAADVAAQSLAIDAQGDLYITGAFSGGPANFSPTGSATTLSPQAAASGQNDSFVSKLDANGNLLWTQDLGGTGSVTTSAAGVDAAGNVYLAGSFSGSTVVGSQASATTLTSAGGTDALLLKLDAGGSLVWATSWGGTANDSATAIAIDASGNVYAAGSIQGSVQLATAASPLVLDSPNGASATVFEFNAAGQVLWADMLGGSTSAQATALALDAQNNLYVGGVFSGSVQLTQASVSGSMGPTLTAVGTQDAFVLQLAPGGAFGWADDLGSSAQTTLTGLVTDSSGDLDLSGYFSGTATLGSGANAVSLVSAGSTDVLVAQLDTSGNLLWARDLGGSAADQALALAVDQRGNFYTTGSFASANASFDPDSTANTLSAQGTADMFLSRLTPNPVDIWTGLGNNDNWSNGANWATGVAPTAGANVEFDFGAAQLVTNNDLASGTALGSITIVGSGYALNGNMVQLASGGSIRTDAAGGSNTIGMALTLSGTTDYGSAVVVSANNGMLVINGVIQGSGGLESAGSGQVELAGDESFLGTTWAAGGMLMLDGSLAGSVVVNAGGLFSGVGTIAGGVTVSSGGVLVPGDPTGVLAVGSLAMAPGSTLQMSLGPGGSLSQIVSQGFVSLGGATLELNSTTTPVVGTTETLVSASQNLPILGVLAGSNVDGTLAGLNEGGTLVAGGSVFAVSYLGGSGAGTSGNNLTLTALPSGAPPTLQLPSTATVASDANLTFSSASGNAIAASDLDVGSNPVQMILSVDSGTLALSNTTGLTFAAGSQNSSSSLTFTGSLNQINAALDGLVYSASATTSVAHLSASISDLGQSGTGKPQVVTGTVAIGVGTTGAAPVLSLGGTVNGTGVLLTQAGTNASVTMAPGSQLSLATGAYAAVAGDTVTTSWQIVDASGQVVSAGNSQQIAFQATAPQAYQLSVTATDALGQSTTQTRLIDVVAVPPTISNLTLASVNYVDSTATITGTLSDPQPGDKLSASVAWGDGTTSTAQFSGNLATFSLNHLYSSAGSYAVQVTAAESNGSTATQSVTTNVLAIAPSAATPLGPILDSLIVSAPTEGQAPNTIVLQLDRSDLDPSALTNSANYSLVAVNGSQTTPVALATSIDEPDAGRVLLHLASSDGSSAYPSLASGTYQLTIQGYRLADGTPLGGSYTVQFIVPPTVASEPAQLLLAGNAQALENFVSQELAQAESYAAQLTSVQFAQQLLADVSQTVASTTGSAAQVAQAVDQQLAAAFVARENQLPFAPSEYAIVWGSDARFLLSLPQGSSSATSGSAVSIGYAADGTLVQQVNGAVVVSAGSQGTTGTPSMSLAIVPIDDLTSLSTTSSLLSVSGGSAGSGLVVQLGLQGLAATNEAGLVTFGATQAPASFAFANAPLQTVNTPVDLSSVVSGLSPMVSMINQQVLDGASAVFGTQTTGGQGVLAVWLDPVDFVLTDAQGNQVGTVDGQSINTIPNAFLSTSSSVDLLLVPAASASQYNLSLLGNGSDFRGALNLISSDGTSTVPVEGNLASGQNLVAVLDFRQSAATSGGLTSTTPTSPTTPAPTSVASLASTAFVGLDRLLSVSALAPLGLARTALLAMGSGPIETLLIGIGGVSQAGANVPSARVEIGAVTARLAADGSLAADFVLPPGEAAWSTRVEQAATDATADLELVGIRIDRQKDAATVRLEYVLTRPTALRPQSAALIWAGPNHKFGDADDRRIELVRPEVQAADKRLELQFEAPDLAPGEYRLMIPAPLTPAVPVPPLRTSLLLPTVGPVDGSGAVVDHQPADDIADVDRFWETWLPAKSKRDAVVIRSDERLAVSGADRG